MTNIHQSHSDAFYVTQDPVQKSLAQAIELVLTENRRVLEKVNYPAVSQLAQAIVDSKRIFVSGEGRSGLVLRMFAMRLMHLGCQDYVVGETITPSIQAGDLLIDCSGSGDMIGVHNRAERARELENLGVTYLELHCGLDEQAHGLCSLSELQSLRDAIKIRFSVAGGINENSIQQVEAAGADMVAVGAAIYAAKSPGEAAHRLREKITP